MGVFSIAGRTGDLLEDGLIAVLIEKQVREFLDWGFAAALSMVLLAAALIVYAGFRRLMKSDLSWS